MSVPKYMRCDCCGKTIPYRDDAVHMEYCNYTAGCAPFDAGDRCNPDFCHHSADDKIFGLVELHVHRSDEISTTSPYEEFRDGSRCVDVCPECKIRFLEQTIKTIKIQNGLD